MSSTCSDFVNYIRSLVKTDVLETACDVARDLYSNGFITYGIIMNELEEYIFED